jgi:hypothetical protein
MFRKFPNKLETWIEKSLASPIPDEVVAYTFNLAEPWCIEVVGCDRYDPADPDWACDEVFRPKRGSLNLPSNVFGDDWETVLKRSISMVSDFLQRDTPASRILKGSKAVAIGFVDGDSHLIWPQQNQEGEQVGDGDAEEAV